MPCRDVNTLKASVLFPDTVPYDKSIGNDKGLIVNYNGLDNEDQTVYIMGNACVQRHYKPIKNEKDSYQFSV